MLGDRVKLITLVIAFSMGEGSSLAITFAAVVISVVVLTEVVSHLFVRHFPTESRIATSVWQAPYRMFLEFNMHSFLIYGLGILPAGKVGLLGCGYKSTLCD